MTTGSARDNTGGASPTLTWGKEMVWGGGESLKQCREPSPAGQCSDQSSVPAPEAAVGGQSLPI